MIPALARLAISDALQTRWLGRSFEVLEEVDSTNVVLSRLASEGAPAGTMIIADFQTEGRGRRERRWHAPPRTSLLFSILLRPGWPVRQAQWLTMIAGLATVAAIEAVAPLEVGLKWPNDVMIQETLKGRSRWHKTGGILLETRLDGEVVREATVGLGLNVNIARQDLPEGPTPATSLLAATGRAYDRTALLARLLQRLETLYEEAATGRSPQAAWDARLVTRNRQVRVVMEDGVVEGVALGSDAWGRLLVRTAENEVRRFAAGDVTLADSGSAEG